MKIKTLLSLSLLVVINQYLFGQILDQELGAKTDYQFREGLYDFSDQNAVNIKVAVWGYIPRPGKYIVPEYTSISDLLSYAGGPFQDAEMDDLRIFRTLENGKEELIKFSYNDIMWEENLSTKIRYTPELNASDILVIPGSPKLFFKDWFNIAIQSVSIVLSVINLVLLINLYN